MALTCVTFHRWRLFRGFVSSVCSTSSPYSAVCTLSGVVALNRSLFLWFDFIFVQLDLVSAINTHLQVAS